MTEIVSPWWSYTKAITAIKNWADAVYLWVPFTSLRMRQNKVKTFDEVKKTIKDVQSFGKKAYLTMNIFPRNKDIQLFESMVEKISNLWADAIIFSDPWTFNIIRKYNKDIPLHLSTQTNILNKEAVKFWYDLWVKRIVLARELNIKEIKEIKEYVPDIELEVFVHGAMCMTYSGRCLLWEYFSWRDGNKWECSHVCRYKFNVYVEEEKRPGKFMKIEENWDWSHLFSSKDLCTIEKLWEILPFVDWLKIEWRSKSEWYSWSTARAYSHVRDCILQWKEIDLNIKNLVYDIPHRQYWDWFIFNNIKDAPDWESFENIKSISHDNPWPIKTKTYYWLTYDKSIEKNWKIYYKFVSKQDIFPWDELNFLWKEWICKTKVIEILSASEDILSKADCNKEYFYISFDKKMEWYETFFK